LHAPQWALSLRSTTQTGHTPSGGVQGVIPAPQLVVQAPAAQNSPAQHPRPHPPQCRLSLRVFTHIATFSVMHAVSVLPQRTPLSVVATSTTSVASTTSLPSITSVASTTSTTSVASTTSVVVAASPVPGDVVPRHAASTVKTTPMNPTGDLIAALLCGRTMPRVDAPAQRPQAP